MAAGDVKDYHVRPVLSVRIDADLKAFAVAEAKRPGMTLGDVVGEALADLRAKRTVKPRGGPCSRRCQSRATEDHPQARERAGGST